MSEARATARSVEVQGQVQGVFFRARTRDRARELGVAGWVRNRADGSVQAHLEGPEPAVEELLDWIRAGGPRRAVVEHVEVARAEPEGVTGFRVRRDAD